MDSAQPLLRVNALTVSVQRRTHSTPVVRDLNLVLKQGETLGIVGESGSGKSVAMLSIMGLLPAPALAVTSGSVKFRGQQLVGAAQETLQKVRGAGMAMVYQDPMVSLNPVMRIGDQIDEGMIAHGMHKTLARTRTLEVLAQVGIPDPLRLSNAYPHELSGGMCQRIMIASALALSPQLLIFDEPTTALDVTIQQQILYLVRQLQRTTGVAVIWITHDLGVLAHLVERVAVMYGGRIVEENDIHSLFREPLHPYTEALLAAVPDMRDDERAPLRQIPGAPPDIEQMPGGCAFQPRCPHAVDQCEIEVPVLKAQAQGRDRVACWVSLDSRQ